MTAANCLHCGKEYTVSDGQFCPQCGHGHTGPRSLGDGRYALQRSLGEGGMGHVFLAEDQRLNVLRAIKLLKPSDDPCASRQEMSRERMLNEARAAQRVGDRTHHAIQIYDVGLTEAEDPYLVMEYLEGETLSQRVLKGPIDLDSSLELATQIIDALSAAHGLGMVHRDLKPDNIMLIERGGQDFVKVLDFGLVKLQNSELRTETGVALGTLSYMAPEQIRGAEVDARADIYAFGGLLYEMLSGVRANPGVTQAELLSVLLDTGARPLSEEVENIPPHICALVDQCLALDPNKRPADLTAVGRRLQEPVGVSAGSTDPHSQQQLVASRDDISVVPIRVTASVPTAPPRAFNTVGGLMVLLAIALGIGLLFWSLSQPPPVAGYKAKNQVGHQVGNMPESPLTLSANEAHEPVTRKDAARPELVQDQGVAVPGAKSARVPATVQFKWRTTDKNGWLIEGPDSAHVFGGLLIKLLYGSLSDGPGRWARLPRALRRRLEDRYAHERPVKNLTRLAVSAKRIRSLMKMAPMKLNLPQLGKVWVFNDGVIFFDTVGCRSLNSGDSLLSARWTIRGYEKGKCRGQKCGRRLVRVIRKSTQVGEDVRLNMTVNRSDSESEIPNRRHITCVLEF